MCVCVCVCACVRACVRVCVCVCQLTPIIPAVGEVGDTGVVEIVGLSVHTQS